MPDDVTHRAPDDVTRRTFLAEERTWLAWWRSGIAAATAAVAVGGLAPRLLDDKRTGLVLLGAGYALLAVAVFVAGWRRHATAARSLERGAYAPLETAWVTGLSLAAGALALATFVVVLVAAP
jgi:inner membrane protein YidH